MTDAEFIAKLTKSCDTSDFDTWIDWNWSHPQWRELSTEPQFRDWFYKVFDENGYSESDEHYAYLGETEIEKELGSRLSWFSTWKCFGTIEHLELSDENDFFPLYAHAFDYGDEKYWVLTMVGQGAISWLMTDEAFKKEYGNKGELTMEKVETKIKQIEDRVHYFYCDDCGVELGHSHEHDDGYYEEFGQFGLQMHTPRGWYKLHKCLCDKCKNEFLFEFYDSLEAAGFKLERY